MENNIMTKRLQKQPNSPACSVHGILELDNNSDKSMINSDITDFSEFNNEFMKSIECSSEGIDDLYHEHIDQEPIKDTFFSSKAYKIKGNYPKHKTLNL